MASITLSVWKLTFDQAENYIDNLINNYQSVSVGTKKLFMEDFPNTHNILSGKIEWEDDPREALDEIIQELDVADEKDIFGTEGWKYYLEIE